MTLDTEPETPGRPQPSRPGCEQIVFLALPDWHPLYQAGHQEVVAMLYRPATTYMADRIEGGAVVKHEIASGFDVTGWIGIIDYFGDLEAAETERQELWQAVKAMSRTELLSEEVDPGTVDPAAGRFGNRDAWGV